MAAMVSGVWVKILCIFYLFVVSDVRADDCTAYWDSTNKYHSLEKCEKYCCGDCRQKSCCREKEYRLSEKEQKNCPSFAGYDLNRNLTIVAIVLGTVIPIIVLVCLVVCCVVPCCLCYKKCRKQRNQRQTVVTNTVMNVPHPPYTPSGAQVSPLGYQAVPGYDGSTLPTAPPPSYVESIAQSYQPAPFQPGQPTMYPLTPTNQPWAPSLPADEVVQPPYNPAYGQQP